MVSVANDIIGRAAVGSDPERSLQLIGLPSLMQLTVGVPAITVALIDGPVALEHPDLVANKIRVLSANAGTT